MDNPSSKIAKNTSYFTVALVIQKLLSFAYFSYIAVQIGASNLGSYTFALSFTTIFAVLMDIGLSNVLVREVSKNPEKSQSYLNSVLSLKIPLAFFAYAVAIILIHVMPNTDLVRQLVYLAGFIMVIDSFTLTFYSFVRAHHNLQYESIGTVIFQLIIMVCGFTAVHFTKDLRILILAIVAGSLFNLIYSALLIKTKLLLKFFAPVDKQLVKKILIFTFPFALAAIFTRVYGYLDTVLLHQLVDAKSVGYYSIAYKITFALQFIPLAFIASLYPAFSSAYAKATADKAYSLEGKRNLGKLFEKSFVYLGVIVLPIAFGVIALAQPLILKVYTEEFSASILPLQILISSLPFLFLNFPLGSLLNACDRQNRNTAHIGIVMVINAILNIILIPRFSYIGAAIASSVSTVIMFGLQLYVAKQIISINYRYLILKFLAIISASIIMYLGVIYLLPYLHFIYLIPIGSLIYFIILFLLKGFNKEDLIDVKQSFKKSPALQSSEKSEELSGMKILLITMEWPPFKGGVGNYYFNLTNELAKQGIAIQVMIPQARLESRSQKLNLAVSVCPFFYRFFWPKWLKLYFEIKKTVKQFKPDLIWVGQVLPVGEAAYLIKKNLKIPYFVSTHGLDILLPQKSLRKDKILKNILNNAAFITANSEFTKKELLDLEIPEEKIEIVYPCPNIKNNQTIKKSGNQKTLLTVGRLVKRKGQEKVIDAMPHLLKKFPDLNYLIIGEGPEKNNLEQKIKNLKLVNKVKILDNVINSELAEYYSSADIFVMPVENLEGDAEGFGIVYLEAALFGLPVIGGNSGGAKEAILDNQTGLLVEPNNQQDLIEKITLLLEDTVLAEKLGWAGKNRVLKEFIWKNQADKLINQIKNYGGRK